MIPQYDTCRCHLFEQIAADVWKRIIRAHQVGRDLVETGITAEIISDILQYTRTSYPNFDVYAKSSWNEAEYGSDMDVYVETKKDQYKWYALQAKILKANGTYTSLRDSSDGIMQWDKLRLLEGLGGCQGYYLLFNGVDNWCYNGADHCNNQYDELQFGCSIVKIEYIENVGQKKTANGQYKNPRFMDLHPTLAEPWRILTCCRQNTGGFTLYTKNQIINSDPKFKKMLTPQDLYSINENIEEPRQPNIENPIANASREANWMPDIKLIINRTT